MTVDTALHHSCAFRTIYHSTFVDAAAAAAALLPPPLLLLLVLLCCWFLLVHNRLDHSAQTYPRSCEMKDEVWQTYKRLY